MSPVSVIRSAPLPAGHAPEARSVFAALILSANEVQGSFVAVGLGISVAVELGVKLGVGVSVGVWVAVFDAVGVGVSVLATTCA